MTVPPHPQLDLVLERIVELPPAVIWHAWTDPERLKEWFCPVPWSVAECEIDLRPGGLFRTVMRSPEGQEFPDDGGCYLEVVENRRLVWTNALLPGFRPAARPEGDDANLSFFFTGLLLLEPHAQGTRYTAIARHGDEATAKQHAAMGFHEGWGIALDQLIATAKKG